MPGTVSFMKQSFPGKPTFTEENMPDLAGQVIIVTGSNTGLGKETAQILYAKGARVYMMARSQSKTDAAMASIREAVPKSRGELAFIPLDLSDYKSIREAADAFLARESALHVLINNAGVGYPEAGSRTKQGWELQLGVNCIGTWLFTQYLTPTIVATSRASAPGSVRVVWVSSSAAEAVVPSDLMPALPSLDTPGSNDKYEKKGGFPTYCLSKLGSFYYGAHYAALHRDDGVVSVPLNPGNLDSDFWRTQGALTACMLRKTLLHPPRMGAYTVIFAGFSPEVTMDKSGTFVAPWGQFWEVSKEMKAGAKPKSEGGTGDAEKFWKWTESQLKGQL